MQRERVKGAPVYVKIFPQMYDGTLATRGPWEALVTFQQLLVLADPVGIVDMTSEAISRRTTIPLNIITAGITALEQPDPESRSPAEDGRRIVRLSEARSWGWRIVNYLEYRDIRDEEHRREYQRRWAKDARARKSSTVDSSSTQSTCVDTASTQSTSSTVVDPSRSRGRSRENPSSTGVDWFAEFWKTWPPSPRKVAKDACEKMWKRLKLYERGEEICLHVEGMKQSKQWLDGYEPSPLVYLNQGRFNDPMQPPAGEVDEDDMDAKMRRAM
jgi:hypothetical protein